MLIFDRFLIVWRSWAFKNITLTWFGVIFAFLIFKLDFVHYFLTHLGYFGYVGAFFAGFLFVSVFTLPTALVILVILAENLSPWQIGISAGAGAVLGDFLIFRFIQNSLLNELFSLYSIIDRNKILFRVLHLKHFSWILPLIGVIVIASPLPDEIGLGLLGMSKIKTWQFVLVTFLLNSIGVFLFVTVFYLVD